MKKKTKWIYLAVFMGIVLFFFSCNRATPIARVGNYLIYLQELEELIESRRGGATNSMADISPHINTLVEEKLKLCDAYRSGFDQDSVVVSRIKDIEARRVYSHIIDNEIIDRIVKESMIRERYKKLSKEWRVRHIYLPFNADSVQTIASLKKIRSRALRGEDFGELAREYSKDTKSAGKNGDLGFIKYDPKEWGAEIFDTISRLHVGQISEVIKSAKGWHIIKLEQVREAAQQQYEKEKESIRQRLMRENAAALDSTYRRFRRKIEDRYNAQIIEDNIDSLLSLVLVIQEKNRKDKVNMRRDPKQFLDVLSPEERDFQLAVYKGGAYTFENLLTTYNEISPMRRPALDTKPSVLEFLNRNVPRVLIIKYGYSKYVHLRPDIKKSVRQEKESGMIARIRRVKVDNNVNIPEEELLAHYNEHLHWYENDISVNVQEILVSDSSLAYDIYQKAMSGENFDSLAVKFNERQETKEKAGVLGFITWRQYGSIGRAAVRLKQGEISEPIKYENRFSIVKIRDRQAGELKPFEDVRAGIRREKRIELRDKLYDEWLEKLRQEYPIAIFSHVIMKQFEITNDESKKNS
ncbi:hypothetical protein EH223_18230 [candidate division KSB1 bacterium]|nr:peptidylprolyl isomerase [candidate division KSB1 bacterium]RQW00682.1 MAG: hypothetical protein EH223_18230 [candidate division KSB1 bacterium]